MHPVYTGGYICEKGCDSEIIQLVDEVYVVKPITLEEYINNKISMHNDKNIIAPLGNIDIFNRRYFELYKKEKEIDISRMREKYDERLMNYWSSIIDIKKSNKDSSNLSEPEDYVDGYWRRVNEMY